MTDTISRPYSDMLAAVQRFHDKNDLQKNGGEDLVYRVALMAEELGELSACVTKGKPPEALAEECVDLFILLLGTAISADFDLEASFWTKMDELMQRPKRRVGDRIRVTRYSEESNTGDQ